MSGLWIDDMPKVHANPHDTEVEAAASVAHSAKRQRAIVLDLFRQAEDGLTDDEGGALMRERGFPHADRLTFGRRRQELYEQRLVDDSPQRRLTPRGRKAIVWVIAK